jgi:RNA polymerase sigma factor (sigma-70 family)
MAYPDADGALWLFEEMAAELVAQARAAGPNSLTEAERQKLVLSVVDWCRKLANAHYKTLRESVRAALDVDDLHSEAFVAATEAAEYFDPRRGIQFTTFSAAYIRTHLTGIADPRHALAARSVESAEEFPDRAGEGEDPAALAEEAEEAALIGTCERWNKSEEEVRQIWRRLLSNLPEPTREIVRLLVFERQPASRIAMRLGMKAKDVRLHLRNAAKRLTKAEATGAAADVLCAASGNGDH